MQRLRTTFQRSRTPTGSEMKTQSSLEVPKQVRSASFDEIQSKRLQANQQSSDPNSLLRVPHFQTARSKSVDSNAGDESGNFLDVPSKKSPRRKSSGAKPFLCVHCMYLEESKQHAADKPPPKPPDYKSSLSISELSTSSSEDDLAQIPQCSITVTVSPTPNSPPPRPPPPVFSSPTIECFPADDPVPPTVVRRRSIQRQEAFLGESTGNSLEDMKDTASDIASDGTSEGALSEIECTTIPEVVVRDIYLQVPDLKRDRAASVDSCFSKVTQGKTEELQHSGVSLEVPVGPNVALRSRSVDIVLPTDEQARYKALAMAAPPGGTDMDRRGKPSSDVSERVLRNTPDWTEGAIEDDHLWVPTSVSGDFCYVGDPDCTKHGIRLKCSACNIVAHQKCIPILLERIRFTCKATFKDVGLRQYREQSNVRHHWVHRRSEKGKCKQCGKSFQSKLSFGAKEIVAINCSWCKVAFHNKETCFGSHRMEEACNLGVHSSIIVPPSWIIKLPGKGNFKSSLRKTSKKTSSSKKRNKEKDKDHKAFVIKPIPSTTVTPVIVFINPKSGGNQGTKLLQKFQWLLNPRQVFDLTQGGPKMGLELFRKVPNLRVLACGGDGTVGWVLSVIDQIGISPAPAVGTLPLGTGNDLARALGWGGGYTDEPISKILMNISNSETVLLDRWSLKVEKNPDADPNEGGKENLPLNVVNNYFSLGVDAHIALEFHEAREAHPEKFNSRLRNKMFYGQMGGKDLLKRKWKGLAELVTLECDGRDLTSKLKELKVHAVVFLNIPSYGGGTRPWNRAMGSYEPSTDDGLIEVVGLTTYQLPLLQAGGHGTCITQCKTARIVTSKTIPMQVDGEACKLAPSIINLTLLNKATMLTKRKGSVKHHTPRVPLEDLSIKVHRIAMRDYEQNHYDRDMLTQSAIKVGTIELSPMSDLEQVRAQIDQFMEESNQSKPVEWCFLDSCTAERFFRIDKAQEHLHYVSDIAYESLYILDCGGLTVPQTPEDETAVPSNSSMHTTYTVPEMKVSCSSEGSLDSPSDHPPISPKTALSPDDDVQKPIPIDKQNGERRLNIYNAIKIKSDVVDRPNEALIKASIVGDLQMIKKIHSMGHSLTTIDNTGQTILHHAVRNCNKEIIKYALSTAPTAIVEITDNSGQTALHKAAMYKCRNICCMLIAAGASLEAKDNEGLTPRLLAIQANDHDLAAYLESQEHFGMISNDLGSEV